MIFILFFFVFFFMSMLGMLMGFYLFMIMKVMIISYIFMICKGIEFNLIFFIDWMSMFFIFIVCFISSMIFMYSKEYMANDVMKNYFIVLLVMFVISMMLVIMGMDMIMILLGWDGLGLVSYLLVIFYSNEKSYNAGMITIMSNRIGDIALLLSVVFFFHYGNFMFSNNTNWMMNILIMLIIIASLTKSAQIPFSAWLPAAMLAPTPVSALVHSSTLVTAGIYMMIRFNNFFLNNGLSKFLLIISLMTLLLSGVGAMLEIDLKKIIALSTLSQLALMMVILSFGKMNIAFFHLLTHALFKAMLFMCAGALIHYNFCIQDIRLMSSMFKFPLINYFLILSSFSLIGFPFLSGFYSKDLIMEFIYAYCNNMVILVLMILCVISSFFYSVRLLYYLWWSSGKWNVVGISSFISFMEISIMMLGMMVLFFGCGFSWMIIGMEKIIIVSYKIKFLNCLLILISGWMIILWILSDFIIFMQVINFFSKMWFLPFFSTNFTFIIMKNFYFYNLCDYNFLENFGSKGFMNFMMFISKILNIFHNINVLLGGGCLIFLFLTF
uniref:NADH:ubiquinone reductase (H(+)-translocating) n=1 Tax=Nuttalliella namaqua TaxID=1029659 RepID=A0A1P8AGA4_9ACAR|nr:NADH dehydrogenase subunit 5 [Nuttalliella namaqua]